MEKTPKISKDTKEDICSEPGCLCAPFVYLLGIFGFIIKLLGREIKAERTDSINQAEDCYFPKDKTNFNQKIHTQEQGRG